MVLIWSPTHLVLRHQPLDGVYLQRLQRSLPKDAVHITLSVNSNMTLLSSPQFLL